jgi:hypothetical protein
MIESNLSQVKTIALCLTVFSVYHTMIPFYINDLISSNMLQNWKVRSQNS